ncbi:hypothetical protein C5167_025990 [Papaver somniferum]|uniref:Uncharacterized protein n=1 Tax=Papaver somniferum TaxID=3469 RepID=A0A4Y7JWU3_PAPSO|nr:uncharacterized protein LOC113278630 [Papaver somniferum]RZC64238.1 hypothetical protein C5167_025990 [Papaver somniferum]
MAHNENTPFQLTEGPSHSRRRLYSDSARNPSMRGIQFNPLMVNPSSSRSALVPPVPLSQGERHQPILPTGVTSQHSLSHLEPWRASSSNPSSKRDFSSAFDGLDFSSIFRQSVAKAVDAQTGWFPDIQSPEDFEYQCGVFSLGAKWAYDAVVDNNIRATEAEDQVSVLRSQLAAILASLGEDRRKAEQQGSQLGTILASLEDDRRKADQQSRAFFSRIGSIQVFLEKEMRLREQAYQGQQAVSERVKELEGKMAAVMQGLEQKRAGMDHMVNVNTSLQPDIAGGFEHPLGE